MKITMNIPADIMLECGSTIHRGAESRIVKSVRETGNNSRRYISGAGFHARYVYEKEVIVEV